MKRTLFTLVAAATLALALAACAAPAQDPAAPQARGPTAAQVQIACAGDDAIRPLVTLWLDTAGTAVQRMAVEGARAGIDRVCLNPAAPLDQAAYQAFLDATARVARIYGELRAQRAAAARPANSPAAASAPTS